MLTLNNLLKERRMCSDDGRNERENYDSFMVRDFDFIRFFRHSLDYLLPNTLPMIPLKTSLNIVTVKNYIHSLKGGVIQDGRKSL